ncbi:MAG: hypothetical protein ACYC7E_16550 [Armatimonadota bacterium]
MPTRRFPLVPVVAAILQVVAVVLLVVFFYQSITEFINTFKSWSQGAPSPYGMGAAPAIKGFWPRIESLVRPLFGLGQGIFLAGLSYAIGSLIQMTREIEFSVRAKGEIAEAPKAE